MAGISFFTPVQYNYPQTIGEQLVSLVDSYFALGGRVAVVVPGAAFNGSEGVSCVPSTTTWWKTTLKVLSYATIILPLIMLAAKAILRANYRFHENYKLPEFPDFGPGVIAEAPLTLVRADRSADLKISVLFNEKFRPWSPMEPTPSEITTEGHRSKYSWDVVTNQDGTLRTSERRISMIWWEAIRHEAMPFDLTKAICVKRTEIKEFLNAALKKMGVQDKELEAFTHYWSETFKTGTPYILVQPIHASELGKFLPDMEIEGKDAELFALSRCYFRFAPVSERAGIDAAVYLNDLKPVELGATAVIDLGGEVVNGNKNQVDSAAFIKKYIYA